MHRPRRPATPIKVREYATYLTVLKNGRAVPGAAPPVPAPSRPGPDPALPGVSTATTDPTTAPTVPAPDHSVPAPAPAIVKSARPIYSFETRKGHRDPGPARYLFTMAHQGKPTAHWPPFRGRYARLMALFGGIKGLFGSGIALFARSIGPVGGGFGTVAPPLAPLLPPGQRLARSTQQHPPFERQHAPQGLANVPAKFTGDTLHVKYRPTDTPPSGPGAEPKEFPESLRRSEWLSEFLYGSSALIRHERAPGCRWQGANMRTPFEICLRFRVLVCGSAFRWYPQGWLPNAACGGWGRDGPRQQAQSEAGQGLARSAVVRDVAHSRPGSPCADIGR